MRRRRGELKNTAKGGFLTYLVNSRDEQVHENEAKTAKAATDIGKPDGRLGWRKLTHVNSPKSLSLPHTNNPLGTRRARIPAPMIEKWLDYHLVSILRIFHTQEIPKHGPRHAHLCSKVSRWEHGVCEVTYHDPRLARPRPNTRMEWHRHLESSRS